MSERTGFTLIEVIISSIVFLLIATALANITKMGMIIDREEQINNEVITNMVIGRRLLLEGAPIGSPVGDKGLLQADEVFLSKTVASQDEDIDDIDMIEYKTAGERYHVWVASPSSMLVRHRVYPYLLPRETLMGDSALKIKVTMLEKKPFFQDSRYPGLVVGTWLLYEDRNLNDVQDIDELSVPFRFSVALRNIP
ncbi:MAG: prepilin-type N-terminal cleavage/methylation domain-containing protein [Terrimicrobiaceae bacterium]